MILGRSHSGESAYTDEFRIMQQDNESDFGQAGITIGVVQFILKMSVVFYV
jgi:hypothetical protein